VLHLSAPRARNAKAWGIAPGKNQDKQKALKARDTKCQLRIVNGSLPKGHIPRLQRCEQLLRVFPGAMPQAFAFRALGA